MELELPPGCAAAYEVEKALASGGFGTVFLARHRVLDREVALKLLNPEALSDQEAVDRFVNEARVTASLQHPHIVVLLDHGIDAGVPWIAYEYLPATSLRTLMRGGISHWREAFAIGVQVASALAVAHAAGVLHRDIKPENVLLVDDDTVKVADFGSAKWNGGKPIVTGEGVILGTPAYLAPELISGSTATPQSDVYALGSMLYEMITGHVPFDAGTVAASLRDRMEYDAVALSAWRPEIPPAVDAAVLKAIARGRPERYMTALALQRALSELLEDSPSGTLAAYRTAVEASMPSIASGPTVRTVIQPAPKRSTMLMPALELQGRGRVMLALSLATAVLGSLAVLTRPPPPEPAASSASVAGRALSPELAAAADRELDALWQRAGRREAAEAALWTFLTDPSHRPPQSGDLQHAIEADLAAVHHLSSELAMYTGPTVALSALRARASALTFLLTCRRDNCAIAVALPRGAAVWDTAVTNSSRRFSAEAHQRLRPWLDQLHAALTHAALSGAMDRRLALVIDEAWQTSCYVNHELEHFDRAQVTGAFERAIQNLATIKHPGLNGLGHVTLAAWNLPVAHRREALARMHQLAAQFAPRMPVPGK